jgi:UDP-glucose 4-epimerase
MKKVIVTGGAGFIGSHTAVQLANAGYSPVIVDNFSNSDRRVIARLERIVEREVAVHEVDCCSRSAFDDVLVQEAPVHGLIHFAALKAVGASVADPLSYYRNNIGSTATVLESLLAAEVPLFVFSSSCTVYGQPDNLPVTESSPIKAAASPYGRTKQICEDMIDDVVRSGAQLQSVTLRYFNPIGAHPSGLIGELPIGAPENLVPYIAQTAIGLREKLTVFGDDYPTRDGTCVRDYIHVVDLADAHVSALRYAAKRNEQPFNEVFNVGTGSGTTVLEAVEAFEEGAGVEVPLVIGARRPGDVVETYADASKAERVLGWKAKLPLVDAMRDAYRWQCALRDDPL